jgi:hypothetical protein
MAELVMWLGKHVTMAGRTTLVKSALTSIDIFFITIPNIPIEAVLMKI